METLKNKIPHSFPKGCFHEVIEALESGCNFMKLVAYDALKSRSLHFISIEVLEVMVFTYNCIILIQPQG